MKIRTDFVTNSSSYSSAEIVIDNPVLLEILQRYKEMGALELLVADEFFIGELPSEGYPEGKPDRHYTENPAFVYLGEEFSHFTMSPNGLHEILDFILDWFDDDPAEKNDRYNQMKEELSRRKEEIINGYKNVVWIAGNSTNEHGESYKGTIDEEYKFTISEKEGEEFYYVKTALWGSDENIPEGTFLDEIHIINGKRVK